MNTKLYFISGINYTRECYNKILEYFFAKYNFDQIAFGVDCVNSLYANQKLSGLVVDLGDSGSRIVPVLEGHCNWSSCWQTRFGGRDISEMLMRLNTQNSAFLAPGLVDDVKKNLAVSFDQPEQQTPSR